MKKDILIKLHYLDLSTIQKRRQAFCSCNSDSLWVKGEKIKIFQYFTLPTHVILSLTKSIKQFQAPIYSPTHILYITPKAPTIENLFPRLSIITTQIADSPSHRPKLSFSAPCTNNNKYLYPKPAPLSNNCSQHPSHQSTHHRGNRT